MALGFKKSSGVSGIDLATLGSMGLAALGGPIAPLIMATMYGAQKQGQKELDEEEQRKQDIQDFINKKGAAGYDVQDGITWNQERPDFQAEQRARLGRVAPSMMVEKTAQEMYPAPETFGEAKPVLGENNQPGFAAFGNRGGVRRFAGVAPPAEKPGPVGARGWFSDGKNVFEAYENAPGTQQALTTGKWKFAQSPTTKTPGLGETYKRIFGSDVPEGMRPKTLPTGDLDPTGSVEPIPGGKMDPAVMTAAQKAKALAAQPQQKAALDTTTQFYDNVDQAIGKILGDTNTDDVVGAWEGSGQPWALNPLTAQGNATALTNIENLQNMLQVQGLQTMRDASKTGGAVGSVTEAEWPKLSSRFGNIDRRQGEDSFRKQLGTIQAEMRASKQRIQDAYNSQYGEQQPQGPPQGQGMPQGAPGAAGPQQQAPAPQQAAMPPQGAVEALRKNPALSRMFDEKYGPGASARFIRAAPPPRGGV